MNIKQRLRNNALDPRDPDYDGFEDWQEEIAEELDSSLYSTGEAVYCDRAGKEHSIYLLDALDRIDTSDLLVALFEAGKDKDAVFDAVMNLRHEIRVALDDAIEEAAKSELGYRINQAEGM